MNKKLNGALFVFLIGFSQLAFSKIHCDMPNRIKQMRAQSQIDVISVRPEEIGFIDSVKYPIRVHYQENVTSLYTSQILDYAEISWNKLFLETGFLKPHPDGDIGGEIDLFDIYIVTDMIEGVGGYAGFSGYYEPTERQDAVGYLVIANEVTPRLIRGVVAHEIHHVSQMAYDWWEDISFMEGTSVWASDHVFPEENMIWRYFTFYNSQPWMALDFISLANPYQYGTGMWVMYLDEKYGNNDGSYIREIWSHLVQNTYENEPDFIDIIDQKLQDVDTNLNEAFRKFGAWRVFLGERNDGRHFSKAENWTGWTRTLEPFFEVKASSGMNVIEGHGVHPVEQYSHVYFSFPRQGDDTKTYLFDFHSESPDQYHVDAYLRNAEGWHEVSSSFASGSFPRASLSIDSSLEGGELVVIVTNVANQDHDIDTSPWEGRQFSYRFEKRADQPID